MKLVSIELQGFKSFAEKTKIHFTEGITAIIGPNGSGKSNVIEAIRWVMGETSAKSMRGDKMTDVIFSGTAHRKAVNIAHVTLTLDNTDRFLPEDADQLEVGRRLKRDGQSDYFINGRNVRLKDIHNLFMDSGIGRESFSIIGQGQVDQILNNKPEDRRAVIEEAAGVLKYKNRKKEAEAKLEKTKDNLDRVQDILYEIENQLFSLEKDAAQAEEYLALSESLKKKDIHLTTWEITWLSAQFKQDKSSLTAVCADKLQVEAAIEKCTESLQEAKDEKQTLENKLDRLQTQLLSLVRDFEQTEAQILLYDEKDRHFSEDKLRMQEAADQASALMEKYQEKITQLEEQLGVQEDQLRLEESRIQEIKGRLQSLSGSKEESLDALKSDYFELLRRQTSYNNEKTYLEKQAQQINSRLARLETSRTDYQSQVEELSHQRLEVQKELEETVSLLEQVQVQLQLLEEERDRVKQKAGQAQNGWLEMRQNYQDKHHQYKNLQAMQDNYSAYYQGVQAVMKAREKLEGVVGTVAELMTVPPAYEQAVETALASSSQFIVVEDHRAAQRAIDYLKQKRAGRATFLPQNRIQARGIPGRVLQMVEKMEGFVGTASQIIRFDPEFSNIIENLLGHIIVVEDIKQASAVSKASGQRYRVVTLEGDVVNVGGSMTGGASRRGDKGGLFSRQNQLDDLKQMLPRLEKEGRDQAKLLADLQEEVKQKEEAAGSLQKELQDYQQVSRQKEYELQQMEEQLERAEKQSGGQKFEWDQLQQEEREIEEAQEEVRKNLKVVEEDIQTKQQEMEQLEYDWTHRQVQISDYQEELEQVQSRRQDLQVQTASLEKEVTLVRSQYTETGQTLADYQAGLEEMDIKKEKINKEDLQTDLNKLNLQIQEGEKSQEKHQAEREQVKQEIGRLEAELHDLRETYNQQQTRQNEYEIKVSKLETSLQAKLTYLSEEYEISFEDISDESLEVDEQVMESLGQEVGQLKRQIKKMGPVNLSAIEEFREADERHRFLQEQSDDLYSAKADLFSTMEEMDKEVEMRFEKTFLAVQEKFSEIFPQIFGGGQAELSLTDPDDLLHTGIDIKAQPPGKYLRSLNLLSGGERTLTAISLLFSIIQVNPIPFVILDEVEAALDDANVLRFSRYLQKFKEEDIQFLIITHRKGSMEAADTLYGVVMQESGVSSILSVQLKEAEDLVES